MGFMGRYFAIIFFGSLIQVSYQSLNFKFFMNLQKVYNTYQLIDGTQLATQSFSNVGNLNSINSSGPCLLFDPNLNSNYLSASSVGISAVTNIILCEQTAQSNNCPCEWFLFGGFCYQFQRKENASCSLDTSCNSGALAKMHQNVFTYWSDIQIHHPWYTGCNFGFVPYDSSHCFSKISSSANWTTAEKTCINPIGEQNTVNGMSCHTDSTCNHLPTFQTIQDFNTFQSIMNLTMCNTEDVWLGYNSYAYNNSVSLFASTSYIEQQIFSFGSGTTQSGTCVAYSLTYKTAYLADCSQQKKFTCAPDLAMSNCPSGWWKYIVPFCYKLIRTGSLNYVDGKAACVADYPKSSIASFHSKEEWDSFNAFRLAAVNLEDLNGSRNFEDIYIGYRSSNGSLNGSVIPNWMYEDGTDPTWAYWYSTSLLQSTNGSQCAVSRKSLSYQWEPSDCTTQRGIVCKGPTLLSCTDTTFYNLNGECYKYLDVNATSWAEAARLCNQQGATLPIFSPDLSTNYFSYNGYTTISKWDIFQKWRASFGPKDVWMGLTQYDSGKFIWMNPMYTSNYNSIKDYFGTNNLTTDLYVVSLKSKNYTWSTVDASFRANVICHYQKIVNKCPTNDWYAISSSSSSSTYDCYLPLNTTMSFGAGQDYCQSISNLTYMLDYVVQPASYQNLNYLLLAMEYPIQNLWLGYSRGPNNQKGPWLATQFWKPDIFGNNSVWLPNEPNGSNNSNYCAFNQNNQFNTSWNWSDSPCSDTKGVICYMITYPQTACPNGYSEYNGTGAVICYKLFNMTANFAAASTICANDQGFLPSFHSQAEYDDFLRFRWVQINLKHTDGSVWIGLQDSITKPLQWKWSDQTNYNWAAWDPKKEPTIRSTPNCVFSFYNQTVRDVMPWATEGCNQLHTFICQKRYPSPPVDPCPGFSQAGEKCYSIITTSSNISLAVATATCASENMTLPYFPNASIWNPFIDWLNNMNQAAKWTTTDKSWPVEEFWIGLHGTKPNNLCWDDGTCNNFHKLYQDSSMKGNPPNNDCYFASNNSSPTNFTWKNPIGGGTVESPSRCCKDELNCTKSYFLGKCKAWNPTCYAETKKTIICQNSKLLPSTCPPDYYSYRFNICYAANITVVSDINKAVTECTSKSGGTLPSFHSDDEWSDFLIHRNILIDLHILSSASSILIGLNDITQPLDWQWKNNINYNYSQWLPDQEPSRDTTKRCVSAKEFNGSGNVYWQREDCSNTSVTVICQTRPIQTSICLPGWSDIDGNGHCYRIFPQATNVTADQANLFCKSVHATLPYFIDDNNWSNFLTWKENFDTALDQATSDFWIGLNMNAIKTAWILPNNNSTNFTVWDTNMPTANSLLVCVASIQNRNYKWTNLDCWTQTIQSVICQYDQTPKTDCSSGWIQIDKICYRPYNSTSQIHSKLCANNEDLPSFHSAEEWYNFKLYIWLAETKDNLNTQNGIWIGLSDVVQPSLWQWSDNSNYNWSYWNPGIEPTSDFTQNCVIAKRQNKEFTWQRQNCNAAAATIALCQINSTPPGKTSPCTLGWSDVNGDGNCYQIRSEYNSISFDHAKLYCQSFGGTLPCFNNMSDWNNFLYWRSNFGTAANMNTTDFWIGLTNPSADLLQWSWMDNTPFGSITLWDQNMPLINSTAACVASIQSSANQWQNFDCSSSSKPSIICKETFLPLPCGPGWLQLNNICYTTLNASSNTKSNGLNSCLAMNGNLPSFHDDREWKDFVDYVWLAQGRFGLNITNGLWIGLSDTNMPFVWQWSDGTNFNWSNWQAEVEPNPDTSQSCVITIPSAGIYEWRRQSCSATVGFICQKRLNLTLSKCNISWSDVHGDGNCYRIIPEVTNLTFSQALIYCQSINGTLPSFASAFDWNNFQTWRYNFGKGRNLNTSSYWIGLTTPDPASSNWTWIDTGLKNNFSLFDTNRGYPLMDSTETCVASMEASSTLWSNFDCTNQKMTSLICKEHEAVLTNTSEWFEVGDISYKVITNVASDTKSNSLNNCIALGGNLPSFHSDGEWNNFTSYIWLQQQRSSLNVISAGFWVGLEDTIISLLWQWNDGTNYNWTNWDVGIEPSSSVAESCVITNGTQAENFVWRRRSCSAQAGFVCQKRIQLGSANCTLGWSAIGSRCYQIVPLSSGINFFDANETCNKLNGTLPSFDNEKQWNMFLMWKKNFAKARLLNTTDFWLGAQYNNKTSSWEWTDGIVTSFNLWLNWNSNISIPNANQCASSMTAASMTWFGTDCSATMPSLICQLIQYPVDCKMTDWVNGSCAQTCNNSTMISTRTVDQINLNGGALCPVDVEVVYECLDQLPCAIDCVMSEWKNTTCPDPSACAVSARMNSTRYIIVPDKDGGIPCPNDTVRFYDCPVYPVCEDIITQSGLNFAGNDAQARLAVVQDTLPYLVASMSLEDKLRLGHQFNETVKTCLYNQHFCNMERDFHTDYDPSLGNCFTFNFPNKSYYTVDRAGELFGSKMLIYSSQEQYVFSSNDAGFRVSIRNSTYFSFADNMGYNIPTGHVSTFALRQVTSRLLSHPYGDCIPDGNKPKDYIYPGIFAAEGCYRSCYQKHVVSFCGCGDPRYNLPVDTKYCPVSKKICVDYMTSCDGGTNFTCNCGKPCLETSFLPTITKTPIGNSDFITSYCKNQISNLTECIENAKKNFAVLQVFFQQINHISFVEAPQYSLLTWFNDVSNAFGLLLGIDVMVFGELLGVTIAILIEKLFH